MNPAQAKNTVLSGVRGNMASKREAAATILATQKLGIYSQAEIDAAAGAINAAITALELKPTGPAVTTVNNIETTFVEVTFTALTELSSKNSAITLLPS